MKRIPVLILSFAMIICICACGSEKNSITTDSGDVPYGSRDIFAMDTFMTITCYGERSEEALDASEAEIRRLEALLSVGSEESEISLLNGSGTAVLSEDSSAMVKESLEIYRQTDGFFDITVYPLMDLWGFTTQEFRVPDENELKTALESVGSDKLLFDPSTDKLTLTKGQGIDLGGIAKGYCSDRLMEIFKEYDLTCGLVSLGGNVECYKTKPDGSLWRCGIRNPFDPDNLSDLIGVVSTADSAVITSGAYERNFKTDDGIIYHHILDPHTGYPANNGLSSVTVVSPYGILADALSTACYAMGFEKAVSYWQEYGEDFDLVLVTEEGEVYITEPLKDSFTTSAEYHIISKK